MTYACRFEVGAQEYVAFKELVQQGGERKHYHQMHSEVSDFTIRAASIRIRYSSLLFLCSFFVLLP